MNKISRAFWGVGFITAAVFLVLSQLGLITEEISAWNVMVGLLCVVMFVTSIVKRSFGGIFFSLGLAWLTFGEIIGLPDVNFFTMILIVVLLSVGFGFIFPKKHFRHNDKEWQAYEREDQVGERQQVKDVEENGYVRCSNSFGALAKYVNTADFKGGRFNNSFGELKVYLDQANLVNGPVEVYVEDSFGKISLFIPKEWKVVQDISVFAGSVDERNRNLGSSDKILNLVGSVNFGEIEITYV